MRSIPRQDIMSSFPNKWILDSSSPPLPHTLCLHRCLHFPFFFKSPIIPIHRNHDDDDNRHCNTLSLTNHCISEFLGLGLPSRWSSRQTVASRRSQSRVRTCNLGALVLKRAREKKRGLEVLQSQKSYSFAHTFWPLPRIKFIIFLYWER